MYSLRARRKGKNTTIAASSSTRKGKQKAMPVLDLDHDFSDLDDDQDAPEGFIDTEVKKLEMLDGVLSKCQLCGSDKFCKIDRAGNHVNLTMGQRRAWANALVLLCLLSMQSTKTDKHSGIQLAWCYPEKPTQYRSVCRFSSKYFSTRNHGA
jgi:hypothetical protein